VSAKFFWYAAANFILRIKAMLCFALRSLDTKGVVGHFKRNTGEEKWYEKYKKMRIQDFFVEFSSVFSTPLCLINKFGYNFFNTLGIKRNNFA
jgi:hypothetical protein